MSYDLGEVGSEMKRRFPFVRSVARMILVVMGLLGFAGLSAPPKTLQGHDYSTQVEMVELRFPPTNWWGMD